LNIVIRFEGGEEVLNICVILDESFHCVSSYLESSCAMLDVRANQLWNKPQKPDSFEIEGLSISLSLYERFCQALS